MLDGYFKKVTLLLVLLYLFILFIKEERPKPSDTSHLGSIVFEKAVKPCQIL